MAKKEDIISVEKNEGVYEISANGILVKTLKTTESLISYFTWLHYANPMRKIVIDVGYLLPEIVKCQEEICAKPRIIEK